MWPKGNIERQPPQETEGGIFMSKEPSKQVQPRTGWANPLEKHLERAIERHGENSFIAQSIRDQIHAYKNYKSVEETYIAGGIMRET
jgi:hypothetical protein